MIFLVLIWMLCYWYKIKGDLTRFLLFITSYMFIRRTEFRMPNVYLFFFFYKDKIICPAIFFNKILTLVICLPKWPVKKIIFFQKLTLKSM